MNQMIILHHKHLSKLLFNIKLENLVLEKYLVI
jgi:hypothetical protein